VLICGVGEVALFVDPAIFVHPATRTVTIPTIRREKIMLFRITLKLCPDLIIIAFPCLIPVTPLRHPFAGDQIIQSIPVERPEISKTPPVGPTSAKDNGDTYEKRQDSGRLKPYSRAAPVFDLIALEKIRS
jgi:hypothetical protein